MKRPPRPHRGLRGGCSGVAAESGPVLVVAVEGHHRQRRVVGFPHELGLLGAVMGSVTIGEPEVADLHDRSDTEIDSQIDRGAQMCLGAVDVAHDEHVPDALSGQLRDVVPAVLGRELVVIPFDHEASPRQRQLTLSPGCCRTRPQRCGHFGNVDGACDTNGTIFGECTGAGGASRVSRLAGAAVCDTPARASRPWRRGTST